MIIKSFSSKIVVIPPDCQIYKPEKEKTGKVRIKEYNIPADCIVLVVDSVEHNKSKIKVYKVYCGIYVQFPQIDHLLDYLIALPEDECFPATIESCENMSLLYKLDKILTTYNEIFSNG